MNQQPDTYYEIIDGLLVAERDTCRNCGRPLRYGWHEMCRQCDVSTNNAMRRMFRRVDNAFTRREDIRKAYRLP